MAYCDLSDLKEWLTISDGAHDPILASVADAAAERIDAYCGRTFSVASGVSTWLVEPARVGWRIETPDFASTSGLVVETTFDHVAWSSTSAFVAYPLNHLDGFPYTEIRFTTAAPPAAQDARPTVRVTAPFGWASTPAPVEFANKLQAARWFRRKDTPDGLAGGGDFGIVRVNSKLDPDVADSLNQYRRGGHAEGLVVG